MGSGTACAFGAYFGGYLGNNRIEGSVHRETEGHLELVAGGTTATISQLAMFRILSWPSRTPESQNSTRRTHAYPRLDILAGC